MKTDMTPEEKIVESLFGESRNKLRRVQQVEINDASLKQIIEAIHRSVENMNPKTLAGLASFLSTKHRHCLEELRGLVALYLALEIQQIAKEKTLASAPR